VSPTKTVVALEELVIVLSIKYVETTQISTNNL